MINIKKFLLNYYIDIILILIIPLISISKFLFGNGYYFFADQPWPLSNYVNFSAIFSLNSLNGLGFTRIIITFPYYILKHFTTSIIFTQRLFLYYTFLLYTFFAYLFATILVSKFYNNKGKYITKVVKFLIVLFLFDNFAAINLNAAGGTYADGLIMIFIAISVFSFLAWKNMRYAFFTSSFFLIISIFLDPDYATFFILAILFSGITAGLLNKDFIYRLKYAILTILTAIPPVLFVILDFYLTSSTAAGISSAVTVRSYNYGTILFFSGNIKPLFPLLLLGHLWSLIVYSPPNILFCGSKISYVKSLMHPAQLLLPNGTITYIWLFTVIMIPILSFFSIIFKRTRKISLPIVILVLFFYILTLVKYIKPLYYLELKISELPIIGGTIGTTLSLPGHIINIIASMYYILISLTIVNLLSIKKLNIKLSITGDDLKTKNIVISQKKDIFKATVAIFLIFIILFSGWQAFNGSYYPARGPATDFGNNVPNTGGFSPVSVNQSVINAYNLIASQKEKFNILWIGGPEFSNDVYCPPHPTASIPYISYMVSNNMTKDFYYNLLYSNVKYVVISNQDIQKNALNIYEFTFNDAGFNNFTAAKSFLNNISGLKAIYNNNEVIVYKVRGFEDIYNSHLLIDYNGNNPNYAGLPYLFKSLGYNPSFTNINEGINFSIDNNANNSIDTPVYIESKLISVDDYKFYNLNSSIRFSGSGSGYAISLPDNYTLTLWNNNETYYNYSNGVTNLTMTGEYSYGTSISYNGSFDSGAGGFYNNNQYVNLSVTFYAKSSSNGTNSIVFMGEPKTNLSTDNIWDPINFKTNSVYKKYTFYEIFPDTDEYIDFRVFDLSNSSFYIKNLSSKYTILPKIVKNSSLPFGDYTVLNDTIIHDNNKTALLLIKNSTVDNFKWIKFNFYNGFHIKNKTDVAALVLLNNNTSLNGNNKSYIVSIYPSDREYELKYNNKLYQSIPGIYGNSIFIINGNVSSLNDVKIITKGKTIMDIFYIGVILYLMILVYFMIDIYRKNKNL